MRKFYVSYLNIEELNMLAKTILSVAANFIGAHQLLQIAKLAIDKALPTLQASIQYTASSAYTAKLKELDDMRDSKFTGLRMYLLTYQQIGNDSQKDAVEFLLHVIKSFGNKLYNESYEIESSLLQQLLSKLQEHQCQEAINTLNAANIVNDLATAENEFKTVFDKRDLEEGGEALYPQVLEAKTVVNINLQFIISAMEIVNNSDQQENAELKAATIKINETIERIMSTARARKTRNRNEKENEETETSEETTTEK